MRVVSHVQGDGEGVRVVSHVQWASAMFNGRQLCSMGVSHVQCDEEGG